MSASDIDILNPNEFNTEFFCGYLPQWWIDEFNDPNKKYSNLATPINNRNGRGANVTSLDELAEIVTLLIRKILLVNYQAGIEGASCT